MRYANAAEPHIVQRWRSPFATPRVRLCIRTAAIATPRKRRSYCSSTGVAPTATTSLSASGHSIAETLRLAVTQGRRDFQCT